MLEILAPAGNMDCALAAIHNGANAIYLGYSSFSARQSAGNFDEEGLRFVIEQKINYFLLTNTLRGYIIYVIGKK